MSQYIQFFIKSLKGEFLPIGNFSRSCSIYTTFNEFCNIPFEKVAPITTKNLACVKNIFEKKITEIDQRILEIEKTITIVAGCNNSIEDKLEEIYKLNSEIEEWLDIKAELKSSEGYIDSLEEIIDSVRWEDKYNEEKYLYCGIEVGNNPEEKLE